MASRYVSPVLAAALLAALTAPAAAQSASGTLSTTITPLVRLSLSSNSITFPDLDPELAPLVPAAQGPITIVARARSAGDALVTLTVQASDDLRSGVDVLPASLIRWTANGPGFVNGTLSRVAPQVVANWVGPGVRTGMQQYQFENRWSHPSGTYSVTLVYTLSAP